ncbi:hypothetical protein M758_1G246200 [Ceratodon purpureus]|nr:hypothetical protein M758_1G246200 [Ceratodon purpureus]
MEELPTSDVIRDKPKKKKEPKMLVSRLRSSSFLELVPLAYKFLSTIQYSLGSVMLAIYGMTLSFTERAIIVNAQFFSTCSAADSDGSVGATVHVGGSTIFQRSSLLIIYFILKLHTL